MTNGPTRAATTPEAQPRPSTTRLQLPRQPAAVSSAATPALRTLCAVMPPTLFREFLFSVSVGPLSLWVASPGSESSPSTLARKSLTAWVQLTIGVPSGVCDCPERRDLNITDTLAAWHRVRLCSDVAAWAGGWSVRLFAPAPASSPVPGLLSSRTLSVFRGRR